MSLENIQESQQESSQEDSQGSSSIVADSQQMQALDEKTKIETETESNELKEVETQSNILEKGITERETIQDLDSDLYNEVLEKLDIKQKEKKQDIHEQQKQIDLQQKNKVEEAITQDFIKIQKFVKAGLINSVQGQNLKKQVLKKAFDVLVQTEKMKRTLPSAVNKNEGFNEFSRRNPDFFNSDGRKEVLNYLKSSDVAVGKDELSKISEIIRIVEKTAIDGYLKKVSHEKSLRDSNETAKQRLTANAQKSGYNGNLSRTFTREQIGKMSSAEFAKYESAIMEQLKKGRIK